MKWQVYFAVVLATGAAACGVANAIMNLVMIGALNRVRSPENRIPVAITTARQWESFTGNARLPYFRVLKEFHQQFPHSPLYFWSIFASICMIAMVLSLGFTAIFLR
jgi:hypothetical protein